MNFLRKHPKIKGYILMVDYPGNNKPIGHFETYTTGLYSKYPHIWKPVYHQDIIGDEKLKDLGI